MSWTAPKNNWATEDNISTTELNNIGNNLRYLKGVDGSPTLDNPIANHPSIKGESDRSGQTFDQTTGLRIFTDFVNHAGGAQVLEVSFSWPAFSKVPNIVATAASGDDNDISVAVHSETVSGCVVKLGRHGGNLASGGVSLIAIGPA